MHPATNIIIEISSFFFIYPELTGCWAQAQHRFTISVFTNLPLGQIGNLSSFLFTWRSLESVLSSGNRMSLLLGLPEIQVQWEYVHYFFTGKVTYLKYKTWNGGGEGSGRTMKWKEAGTLCERIKPLMKSGGRQNKLNSTAIWLGMLKYPQQTRVHWPSTACLHRTGVLQQVLSRVNLSLRKHSNSELQPSSPLTSMIIKFPAHSKLGLLPHVTLQF